MTAGSKTYEGLAVPLLGESLIVQQTGATDILTIEGGDGQTGDFIVCRSSTETQKLAVTAEGRLEMTVFTTRPTTGLVKGELMLLFHGSTPKIGVCTSTAGQTIKLIRLKTKTFGRLTA